MTEMTDAEIGARKNPAAPSWGRSYGISSLWSEIVPGLWVGGTDDNDILAVAREHKNTISYGTIVTDDAEITPAEFDAVVTMYAWARPADWGVTEYRWHIYDSSDGVDLDDLYDTASWLHRRWKRGGNVLSRCQAGLNRSSLVAAATLIIDGMDTDTAVQAIRDGRSHRCLFNESFVDTLREFEGYLDGLD